MIVMAFFPPPHPPPPPPPLFSLSLISGGLSLSQIEKLSLQIDTLHNDLKTCKSREDELAQQLQTSQGLSSQVDKSEIKIKSLTSRCCQLRQALRNAERDYRAVVDRESAWREEVSRANHAVSRNE